MLQAVQELSDDNSVCISCRKTFREDVNRLRQSIWENLPGVVGLMTWDDLKAMDLQA